MVKNKYALSLYCRFCEEQFVEENIKYYLDAQAYVREAQMSPECVDTERYLDKALNIYNEYCKKGAHLQLNVSDALLSQLATIFEIPTPKSLLGNLTGHEFDLVTVDVLALMTTNEFPRFKFSKYYDLLIAKLAGEKRKIGDDEAGLFPQQ